MIDANADIARRAWVRCTPCGSDEGLYLLATESRYIFVNCPACGARFWLDTKCGTGRPDHVDDLPEWPI